MYLIDTNVISELRKGSKANAGVSKFFEKATQQKAGLFICVVTLGELRRGIEIVRYRGDEKQADLLENWLQIVIDGYSDRILEFTQPDAQIWGKLRVPHAENAIDKQIAAIALSSGLTVVTRNVKDFAQTGVSLLNPFNATEVC